ncbi:MAG: hypothetical protein F6K19_46010 [Cyanothece sp. SIO1E1]|nr:hypothetical protein [Cyanothece sp. SIO1E1]
MNKLLPTIVLIICSISMVSCQPAQVNITPETPTDTVEPNKTKSIPETPAATVEPSQTESAATPADTATPVKTESFNATGTDSQEPSTTTTNTQVDPLKETVYPAGDTHTISNGEWTITVSNSDSWSGVNGTGDLSYRGCDSGGDCLDLTGGKVTCRDGQCTTVWRNKEYAYILEEPIASEISAASTTLIVKQNSQEILRTTGFENVPE